MSVPLDQLDRIAKKPAPTQIARPIGSLGRSVAIHCALATACLHGQSSAAPQDAALMAQLRAAVALAERGETGKALSVAHNIVQAHPRFEPALKLEGALLEDLGNGTEAAAAYEAALQLAPADPELLMKVGVAKLIAGDRDQAIKLFQRRLKLTPRDGDTLFYLAQAYHLAGNNDLALKTIEECLKVDPANTMVWQKYGELLCSSGDNDGALKWLLKAKRADPSLDRIDYDLGVASYKSMDLANALDYATKAAALLPNDLEALELEAAVAVKLAKWQDAEPVFRAILARKSGDIGAQLGLGHCELELKHYPQAAEALERLLQQDPTQILAHFYLSRAYVALGRIEDAQHEADLHSKMLEQVSSAAPEGESEKEKAIWAQAKSLLADGKEGQALDLFRAESKGPYATPGGPFVLTGVLYLYTNRPDDASRLLHRALTLEPGARDAHTYLGVLALQQGDLEKAETEFKAELAKDPNNQTAVAELGEVRYRQGRWADAADQLSRSRTMVPSLLYMLCDSYFQLGKIKDADLTAELIFDYSANQREVLQGVLDLLKRNQQTELAQRLASKSRS